MVTSPLSILWKRPAIAQISLKVGTKEAKVIEKPQREQDMRSCSSVQHIAISCFLPGVRAAHVVTSGQLSSIMTIDTIYLQ